MTTKTTWQPIETAPKDGTRFLSVKIKKDGSYRLQITRWLEPHGLSAPYRKIAAWTGWEEKTSQPTHWMSLPEVPNAEA